MKIGSHIREIREFQKNFKRSYVAAKLNITTRAFANIENDVADITLSRLEEIATILECTPAYILSYKENKKAFINTYNNNEGNKSIIKINQVKETFTLDLLYNLQKELIESERRRILLLENLLRKHNIDF